MTACRFHEHKSDAWENKCIRDATFAYKFSFCVSSSGKFPLEIPSVSTSLDLWHCYRLTTLQWFTPLSYGPQFAPVTKTASKVLGNVTFIIYGEKDLLFHKERACSTCVTQTRALWKSIYTIASYLIAKASIQGWVSVCLLLWK